MTKKTILSKELAFEVKGISETLDGSSTREDVEHGFDLTVECLKNQLGDEAYILNTREHLDNVIQNKETIIKAIMCGYEVEDD